MKLIYWMKWPEAERIIAHQRQCDSEVILMFIKQIRKTKLLCGGDCVSDCSV